MAEAAAVFVGKAVVQPAISYLVKKILDRIPDGDLCKRLQQKLPFVEAILYAVDQQQTLSNPSLSEVVWQLRDAIQEAEDALDSLEFLDLKSSANNRSKVSLSSLLSSISRKFHVADSSRATENLKDALKNLDAVLDNAGRSLPAIYPSSCSHGKAHIQDSASIQEVTKELRTTIFGRLKEKDAIIDWLGVLTPNIRDQKLSLCAIVGAGGMGKTTLAQFVCQDKKVQDHFANKIIWADVSKIFDPKVLVRKISGSFNRYKASADGLDTIMTDKFLLVLDDARDDAQSERWQQFLDLIRKNAPMGGKILLTTQIRPVANAVEGQMSPDTYKCLELGGLDQENTLKLFNHHAFGDLSPSDCFELQLIGEQIARKLKGCPLLARTIGRHLQGNTDHARWNTILNHDIHKVDDVATEIKKVLRLSYESLSNEVQVCFRYCSIFPPHYKFKMEEMVEMWVSSGLILQREDGINNREDIAIQYFNTLWQKSFFSLVPRELNVDTSEDYYVLHDGMHEFSCTVSIGECSRLKATDHGIGIPLTVRHLYVEGINAETINVISKFKYLRTLVVENKENSIQEEHANALKNSIEGRTSLRLLKLYGNGWFCMNDTIAGLEHLRYIYLSATKESNLSKLFKLCHLEVLQILKIEKENESRSISINLPHLQKLHLPKTTVSRIAQIGSLTTLRELNGFSVKRTDGHKITELKDLRKLQKVIVLDVQNVIDHTEASDAELDKKSDLKVLSLEWCADQASCDGRILNKLVPDSNLKHLVISGYNGTRPPLWMESKYFSNLVYLKLDGCVEWDKLPPFGYLWTLKHLFLKNLPKLEYIASSSYSTVVYGYRDTSPDVLPPHLITFVVKNCLGLSELPSLPFSLRYLDIDRVGMSSLPTMCTHMGRRRVSLVESQLSILNVESCNLLVSLNGFLQEEHCRVLTVLSLVCCHMLISLPDASDFKRMSKLESIRIIECNRLSSLGGLEALSYLKVLRIEHCANLVTTSSRLPPASDESTYLKLETLEIDDHQLLAISPIRNLCLTKKLIILEREKMAELPLEWLLQNRSHLEHIEISNAELLKSLPNMHEWHTLRSMLLHNTPLLQSLPLMPPNLWVLDINGCCNELHGECQSGGSEWSKICRIHNCNITPKI